RNSVDEPRIALRTVCREIRSSRTIWRIGLCSTQNARLIRPIVSTVTIPGHAPPSTPEGAFDDSGLGRYSTLITPEAGSLFHAVFHTTIKNTLAALAELTRKGRTYEKAVARLVDDHSAVDDITLKTLQPLASATLAGQS